ncbi:MAG: O-antigen ligase family protein [bacterium]|nr:O-antigen ligase family protein [bacterium]
MVGGATALAFLLALTLGTRGQVSTRFRITGGISLIAAPHEDELTEPNIVGWFETALLAALFGYAMLDRGFAWFHVPGTPLFVGELVLAIGVAMMLTSANRVSPLVRGGHSFKTLRLYMLWGAILLVLGAPAWGLDAIRDSALWYYGLTAFLVASLIAWDPRRLDRWSTLFGRALPFMLIWYPFSIVLKTIPALLVSVPDSNVAVLAHRTGNMSVIAAIGIAWLWLVDADNHLFALRQRIALTSLGTIVILFTGLQNRGGLVATTVALLLLMFMLSRRRGDLAFVMISVGIVLASLAITFDIRLEVFDQRDVSVEQFVGNVTSIFDREAGTSREQDTTEWRLRIWSEVLSDVTEETPIAGFGPGPDLGERYDISTDPTTPLRNPHNSHVGILARQGWVGVMLWVVVWFSWFAGMQITRRRLRARRHFRETAIASWIMLSPVPILVNAIFDPTLEGPQVSIWLWTFYGAGAALTVLARRGELHIDQDREANIGAAAVRP